MQITNYFKKNDLLFALQAILIVLSIFLGWRLIKVWRFSEYKIINKETPLKASIKNQQKKKEFIKKLKPKTYKKRIPARNEFLDIVENNLFHHERIEGIEKNTLTPPTAVSPFRRINSINKIVLEGIVMFGDYKAALIKNNLPQKRGLRKKVAKSIWVHEGQVLSGRKIVAILKDQIIVVDEEDEKKRIIKLYDPGKPRPKMLPAPKEPKISKIKKQAPGDRLRPPLGEKK